MNCLKPFIPFSFPSVQLDKILTEVRLSNVIPAMQAISSISPAFVVGWPPPISLPLAMGLARWLLPLLQVLLLLYLTLLHLLGLLLVPLLELLRFGRIEGLSGQILVVDLVLLLKFLALLILCGVKLLLLLLVFLIQAGVSSVWRSRPR
jgi:hypothetical protein